MIPAGTVAHLIPSLKENEPGDCEQYKQVFANLVPLDLNAVGYLCTSWPARTACKRNKEKQKRDMAALGIFVCGLSLTAALVTAVGQTRWCGHGEPLTKLSVNRQGNFSATSPLQIQPQVTGNIIWNCLLSSLFMPALLFLTMTGKGRGICIPSAHKDYTGPTGSAEALL